MAQGPAIRKKLLLSVCFSLGIVIIVFLIEY